ncbi:MAG: glycosyltransferase family 2 protein, partial [Bacteroidia bacterium]|nr:glycosyltransferase family 2 protein [Bacteroidia bacterium]
MQNNSLVSVVMPVYNAAPYLQKAVESILSQTYQNIELIIIDDGSTDDSMAFIRNYKDKRIQRIEFNENKGIVEALNTGMQAAKGEFIARMDADD